jgi:acetyl-CoA acyltransferase
VEGVVVIEPAWIVGVGMTRFGVRQDSSVNDLTRDAVSIALRDAGAELGDIDAAYFGNTAHGLLEGRHVATGQVALRSMGFERIPIINVENACATGATALHQAALHVRAGAADVVIAVGVDKTSVDGKQSLLVPFNSRVDVHEAAVQAVTHKPRDYAETGGAGRRSVFMGDYADVLRAHIQSFGTTKHQLATVSQKNRAHAVHNPLAHYREAISVDEILSARSIVQPLTMPMCEPLTDGAAAAIVCNNVGLRRLADAQRIWMRATVMQSGSRRASSDWSRSISKRTADRPYEEAGVAPEDVDVAELHDDSAFGEILQTEMMGFCEIGAGGKLAESGATALGGSIATNPSGGLESKGHPMAATGLAQIYELVQQLRGQAGARQVPGCR